MSEEKAQHLQWDSPRTRDAMEIEGLSSAGNDGDGRMVPVMFALFLAGWVLGNQAGFHCGEVVFRLCSLGV